MARNVDMHLCAAVVCAACTTIAAGRQCGNPHTAGALMQLLPDDVPAVTAVQSGRWSDPATWGGTLPGPGDDVRIPADIGVLYDINDDG